MILHSNIDLNELSTFLRAYQILSTNESITQLNIPGEGNMNVVFRIETTQSRSLILKQSRPFVQRYESIPAPLERIFVEHAFYQSIQGSHVQQAFPQVLGFVLEHHLLILQDLGKGSDMTDLYHQKTFQTDQLKQLVEIAYGIHQSAPLEPYPKTLELLRLNHQHIFELPFTEDNGFNLDTVQEGLQALSMPFKRDAKLKERIHSLGQEYLAGGSTLIHGDYYPGSWLERQGQTLILDPEFSYLGSAEFDLGVLSAHALFITNDSDILEQIISLYKAPIDQSLVRNYAGVEVMRRLIGLAQLPLLRTIQEKQQLLARAYHWVMG